MRFTDAERDARYEQFGSDFEPSKTALVPEESCPCFMGGSCPTDYEHEGDKK